MEGDLKMDILKGKRYDIMNVLWEEGRPLSAFEINDIAPELKMPTVRRCLELLLKENLIKVAGTSMNGKVYARNYFIYYIIPPTAKQWHTLTKR